MFRTLSLLIFLLLLSANVLAQTQPVPPLMNFQGRLMQADGTPVADGAHSIRFSLYDAETGGSEKWTQTVAAVNVKNGTFAVLLSGFPAGTFNGGVWLEIQIGTSPPLAPRQPLVSVAYAFKADSVRDGAVSQSSLAPGLLNFNNLEGQITGAQIANETITADKLASNLLAPLVWLINGNAGTANSFLGTTDSNPLELRVNSRRATRFTYAENTTDPENSYRSINILSGAGINEIGSGLVGATIAGGGMDRFTGIDFPNRALADFGTIGGGAFNLVSKTFATIAGGEKNVADGIAAVVAGGESNVAGGPTATVAGGRNNRAVNMATSVGGGDTNSANQDYATVAGGVLNSSEGPAASVGGGIVNMAGGFAATIAGGDTNAASTDYATVAGGAFNNAIGFASMVAGGFFNTASGNHGFAAGRRARARHDGAFVWADVGEITEGTDFASTGANQFLVRASGGMGINTADPAGFALNVAGDIQCVNLTQTSDARFKTNITPLHDALDSILNLRGVSFLWDKEAGKTRHFANGRQIGFLAQEVEKILPELVTTDRNGVKSVAYANIVPVLVEAMKQQQAQITTQQKQIETEKTQSRTREQRLSTLETENAQLKTRLDALALALADLKSERKP